MERLVVVPSSNRAATREKPCAVKSVDCQGFIDKRFIRAAIVQRVGLIAVSFADCLDAFHY